MKSSALIISFAGLLALNTQAGTLDQKLADTIADMRPGDRVDVIIRCVKPLDPKSVAKKDLVPALKNKANACETSLSNSLKDKSGIPPKNLWIINGIAATVPVAKLNGLVNRAGVDVVYLNEKVTLPPEPTLSGDPGNQPFTYWNIDETRAPDLWALGHYGAGVVVATMDTGVDADHADIGPNWRGGTNSWFDPNGQHATPFDSNGHGTGVMGLIVGGNAGGFDIGVAPDAQWIAVKIFDNSNETTYAKIHEGFQWLLDPDGDEDPSDAPDIVNNSWVLQGTEDQCLGEFGDDVAALKAAGIAVVYSAGNFGPNYSTSMDPANDPESLSVGAVDYVLNVPSASSRGPSACTGEVYPAVAAPGKDVLTAGLTLGGAYPNQYAFGSGTSYAAPHVAGAIALLKSAFPGSTLSELQDAIADGALDVGIPGPDDDSGAGMLDLVEAFFLLDGSGTPQPGQLQFSAAAYSADETAPTLTVTVTRTGGTAGEVSVDYASADGTASEGADYQASSGTLIFLDGESSQTFDVSILDDGTFEGDEDFGLTLANPQGGATLGVTQAAVATILDDDAPADGDGDGVSDALDQCPGTPQGEPVDANGCSASQLDSDNDGVSDSLDLCPGTPAGEPVDASGCPLGPADTDGDGFTADVDCDDSDNTVYPGALEVKGDGIDQDCNGFDLTIEVTRARYVTGQDKLVIWATSSLNAAAELQATIGLQGGGSVDKPLSWKASKSRWQKTLKSFASKFGSAPSSVTVYGPEGEETVSVELR